MVVPRVPKAQGVEKINGEVSRLKSEARSHFFDQVMYEINDSLTSILAMAEMKPKDSVSKIKYHIQRINQFLRDAKDYQLNASGQKNFNVTQVLRNLLRMIESHCRKAKLVPLISEIKMPAVGDQSKFEELLLCLLADMLGRADSAGEILIESRQKDVFAIITLLRDQFMFSDEALELVRRIAEGSPDFRGRVRITPQGNGVEVVIRVPLQFRIVNLANPVVKSEARADPQKPI